MMDDGGSSGSSTSPAIELSGSDRDELRLRVAWRGDPPLLSDVLPALESVGLRVADHRVGTPQEQGVSTVRVDDFGVLGRPRVSGYLLWVLITLRSAD
jgi:hypothetical protein